MAIKHIETKNEENDKENGETKPRDRKRNQLRKLVKI
jgi:hypothetical protein